MYSLASSGLGLLVLFFGIFFGLATTCRVWTGDCYKWGTVGAIKSARDDGGGTFPKRVVDVIRGPAWGPECRAET
jgi:hypothetical protein